MQRAKVFLLAVLIGSVAGWASAQDVAAKQTRPALKPQPMKAAPVVPHTWGTTDNSYYRMGASEFTGIDVPGVDDWTDTFYSIGSTDIRRYGSIAFAYFIGTPHLPSGALVKGIYLNDCVDDGSADSVGGTVYSCSYYGNACTALASWDTATGCGFDFLDLSASGYVVDNGPNGDQLVIRVYTAATDGTDSFAGATVEYVLQVSPAPAVATFTDVPTTDFGFQFIEALVASGITGGTGGGLYSPDAPVTRRQMAIFIAKALGLHWQ